MTNFRDRREVRSVLGIFSLFKSHVFLTMSPKISKNCSRYFFQSGVADLLRVLSFSHKLFSPKISRKSLQLQEELTKISLKFSLTHTKIKLPNNTSLKVSCGGYESLNFLDFFKSIMFQGDGGNCNVRIILCRDFILGIILYLFWNVLKDRSMIYFSIAVNRWRNVNFQ